MTRGIWVDLICAIYEQNQGGAITGTMEQLARIPSVTPAEMKCALDELRETNTAIVTTQSDAKTTVVCRRLARECGQAQSKQNRDVKYRAKKAAQKTSVKTTPVRRENVAVESESESDSSSYRTTKPPLVPPPAGGAPPRRDLVLHPAAAMTPEVLPAESRPRHGRNRGVRSRASPLTFAEMRRQESDRQFWQMLEYSREIQREKLQQNGP